MSPETTASTTAVAPQEGGSTSPEATPGTKPTTAVTPSVEQKQPIPFDQLDPTTQEFVKGLRKENEALRKEKQTREEAERAKQDEELKAQNKWQQIAEDREKEVARLKPLEADNLELTNLVRDYINTEIKDWPKEVQDTAPKGEVSAKALVEWANSHRALATKLMESTVSQKPLPKPGNPIGPTPSTVGNRPAGSGNEEPLVEARL